MDRTFVALVVLLSAIGCGGGSAGSGPCDEDPPLAGCGDTCEVDADCPLGLHCAEDGTCTAECSQDGSGCDEGEVCDEHGYCVPDDGDGCPDVSVNLTPITPTVVILIDRSGSMITSGFGSFDTRWEAVEYALTDPTDGVLWDVNSQIIVGASLYTSDDGNLNGGTCPMLEKRAPMPDNAMAIRTLIHDNPPYEDGLDTPTAESVTSTVMTFPEADNRVLILATDGNPDNCDDPDAHNAMSQMMSENAVAAAYDAPYHIPTYVLSVGDDAALSHLQHLARLGRGQDPDTGNAEPYVANSPEQLVDAFGEIIRGVRSCDIDINGTVDLDQADQGDVVMNGDPLEYGTDWTMKDEDTMELIGAACDAFLETDNVSLSAEFPCGGVVVD